MHTLTFTELVLYFAIYSIVGWICEVIYCSVPAKKIVQRGFLAGPYCPVYGFGAVLLISFLYPFALKVSSLPLLFLGSVVITSIIEYFTSWLMEQMFHMRWWDYSKRRFNINGRICLLNSVLFGVMGIVLLYIIQPAISRSVLSISTGAKTVLASLFIAIILIDLLTTLNAVYKLDAKLKEMQTTMHTLKEYDEKYFWYDKHDISASLNRLEAEATESENTKIIELARSLRNLVEKDNSGRRLTSSFKNLSSTHAQETLDVVKRKFEEKRLSLSRLTKKQTKSEEASDYSSEENASFVSGVNFYKLVWVFFISCVVGYVVESIYCLVTLGHIESRQGMIYGPFNQVYGFGGVLMVAALHKLQEKGDRWVFLGSALIGGIFEAGCSWVQEALFGSVSWDYTGQRFSFLGGRTSLVFMFFWGILGVALIKEIYPRLSRFVERIPNKQGIVILWVLVVSLSLNLLVSGLAVHRWSERIEGDTPKNSVDVYLDEKYPDNFLETIYPNLAFRTEDDVVN